MSEYQPTKLEKQTILLALAIDNARAAWKAVADAVAERKCTECIDESKCTDESCSGRSMREQNKKEIK